MADDFGKRLARAGRCFLCRVAERGQGNRLDAFRDGKDVLDFGFDESANPAGAKAFGRGREYHVFDGN